MLPALANWLLAPLAIGQRAYVMARCPLSIRPSYHVCFNFCFEHLWTYIPNFDETSQKFFYHYSNFDEISQKRSYHSLLQNFLKEFDPFKNSGCHGNKT